MRERYMLLAALYSIRRAQHWDTVLWQIIQTEIDDLERAIIMEKRDATK